MGLAPAPFPARETAAQTHAVMRAKSGYDIKQLVSEYRALRASVLSLWLDDGVPAPSDLQDVIRFSEAISAASIHSTTAFLKAGANVVAAALSQEEQGKVLQEPHPADLKKRLRTVRRVFDGDD